MAGSGQNGVQKLRILVIEDNPTDANLVLGELRRAGFEVTSDLVENRQEVSDHLDKNTYDIVLADYNLPQFRGMEAVQIIRDKGLTVPLILISGALKSVTAVECVKQGATDYVLKDHLARLPACVRRAVWESQLREESKQAQAELANKVDELARSNRDLEQFAYVASHDLQEPLRMIATYTQLLAEKYRGRLDENADKYIGYAVEGALRMQALIEDVLAFSRVGRNGRDHVRTESSAALDQALQMLSVAARESALTVKADPLPPVWADHSQLVQLFQNLIGNAIKFRGANPLQVKVSATRQGAEWIFAVDDNGIGIAAEHSEFIFNIFQRLHTRAEYSGNGVGLAICKKIVEQHGGRIWVESAPGQGSSFKFTLPAISADKEKTPHEADSRDLVSR